MGVCLHSTRKKGARGIGSTLEDGWDDAGKWMGRGLLDPEASNLQITKALDKGVQAEVVEREIPLKFLEGVESWIVDTSSRVA